MQRIKYYQSVLQNLTPSMSLIGCLGLISLSLLSCKVGPNYTGPPPIALKPFSTEKNPPALNACHTSLENWWDGFHDAQLTAIIQQAIHQNLDLQAALTRVQQARAGVQRARSDLLPTAGVVGGAVPLHLSLEDPIAAIGRQVPIFTRNFTLYEAYSGATWEIDLFGGTRRKIEFAKAETEAAEALHLGTTITVVAEAADAYFQIMDYEQRLSTTQKQAKNIQRLLKLNQLRKREGVVSDKDLTQLESSLANIEANMAPLRIHLAAQKHRLDVLLGTQANTFSHLASRHIPSIPSASPNCSPIDLLNRRPDIIAAERKLQSANAVIGIATSEYYPKISLLGLLGSESISLSQLFTSLTYQTAGLFGLRWRLFDFGKIDAEINRAKGGYAEALINYRQTILRATEDVENAFVALAQYQQQAHSFIVQKGALKKALKLTKANYREGTANLIDVLESENQLLTTQNELSQAKINTARAAIMAFRALGGGW